MLFRSVGVEILESKGEENVEDSVFNYFEKKLKVGPWMVGGFGWRWRRRRRLGSSLLQ